MSWREWGQGLLGSLVGGAVGAAATMYVGHLDFLTKDRELDIRMVNVALTILSGEKIQVGSGATAEELDSAKVKHATGYFARRYALDVLETYGKVKIDDKDAWAEGGYMPAGRFPGVDFLPLEPAQETKRRGGLPMPMIELPEGN